MGSFFFKAYQFIARKRVLSVSALVVLLIGLSIQNPANALSFAARISKWSIELVRMDGKRMGYTHRQFGIGR